MSYQVQNKYMAAQVNTSHPGELTLMLYNGCIKFIKLAIESIHNNDYAAKNNNIQRALDIIDELTITLNMDYEISRNLRSLYLFISENLIKSNIKMDSEFAQTSMNLLTELRDTWVEALKEVKKVSTKVPI